MRKILRNTMLICICMLLWIETGKVQELWNTISIYPNIFNNLHRLIVKTNITLQLRPIQHFKRFLVILFPTASNMISAYTWAFQIKLMIGCYCTRYMEKKLSSRDHYTMRVHGFVLSSKTHQSQMILRYKFNLFWF